MWKKGIIKVPILLIFLSFRWKVEPFTNIKFQKLNNFLQFLLRFFDFGNVQIKQFWDNCRFWPSIHSIMKSWCDDIEEGTCAASGWILTLSPEHFFVYSLKHSDEQRNSVLSTSFVMFFLVKHWWQQRPS